MVAHLRDGEAPVASDDRMDFLRHYIVAFIERGHPQVCKI